MEDSSSCEPSAFYLACLNNDLRKVRETIAPSSINQISPNGDTGLHIASSKGYTELVEVLLRYHASQKIRNKEGLTAEEVAANDEIKSIFKFNKRPDSDSKHFVGTATEIEWLDSYKNAYRISHENREHMKRWLLKVPLNKLLDEILTGYIEKINRFSNEKCKDTIKDYMKYVIEYEEPVGLIYAYSSGGTDFCTFLNYDLAEIGSDFPFLSTQSLFNSGYLDNEAPKDLGQHVFAAILINHPIFRPYYHTGISYRGLSLKRDELKAYKIDDIVMTRSFLSTSNNENMAKLFIRSNEKEKQPVMCIYKVINPHSSLDIKGLSLFPEEEEILIFPFTVFRIIKQEDVDMVIDDKSYSIKVISLEECS